MVAPVSASTLTLNLSPQTVTPLTPEQQRTFQEALDQRWTQITADSIAQALTIPAEYIHNVTDPGHIHTTGAFTADLAPAYEWAAGAGTIGTTFTHQPQTDVHIWNPGHLNTPARPNRESFSYNFCDDTGKVVGRLFVLGNQLCFEGDASDAAKVFLMHVMAGY